jgi:hypothetical protein
VLIVAILFSKRPFVCKYRGSAARPVLQGDRGVPASTEFPVSGRGWTNVKTNAPFPICADILNRLAPVAWQLWWIWQETQLHGVEPWQFGLTGENLVAAGLNGTDLAWLLERGLLAKRQTRDMSRGAGRRSHARGEPALIVPTETGVTVLEQLCLRRFKPHWDAHRRVLSVEGRAIKVYRQPSEMQQSVLTAFQESEWTDQIDDPLPQFELDALCYQDPKARLRKTVEHLNRAQHPSTLFFSAAGNGSRVCWSFRHAADCHRSKRNGVAQLQRRSIY